MATVESAFVLLDRASGPVRKIRRELRGMQRDAVAAGEALDDLTGPRTTRQLGGLEGEVTRVRAETRLLRGETEASDRQMRAHSGVVRRVARDYRDLGTAIRLLRWPALVAGAGAATQAIGGVGAAAVALVPKLADASGALVAGGNAFVGYGAAAGVAKLATHGLEDALEGQRGAMRRLTPEGRAFTRMLLDQRREVRALQQDAQRGLFPGLEGLVAAVRGRRGAARRIVRQTAGDLGGLARFGARQVRRPGFGADAVALSDQGARAFGAAARSGYRLAHATEQLLLAGGPLTDWLGATVEGWSQVAEREAIVARQTGELDAFFDRTRDSLETLFDVGEHTFGGLQGLLHAASGEGEELWGVIDRTAQRWDTWANSIEGQTEIRRFFDDVQPALDETVGLVGDLGEGLLDVAREPAAAGMIRDVREMVPGIAEGVGDLTANFGPAAVDAIGEGFDLLGTLAAESGPLTLAATALGTVAHEVNELIDALGPLGPALASVAGVALLLRRSGLAGGPRGVSAPAALLGGLGTGMLAGRVMSRRAPVGLTPADAAMIAASRPGRLAVARATGGYARGTYQLARSFGRGRAVSALAGAGGALGVGGVGGRVLLAGAGRILWPIAALQGVLGFLGTEGGVGRRLQGAGSALTLGLIHRPKDPDELFAAGHDRAVGFIDQIGVNDSLAQQRRAVGALQGRVAANRQRLTAEQTVSVATGTVGKAPVLGSERRQVVRGNARAELEAETETLADELKRREEILENSAREARQRMRARAVEAGARFADDFASAFRIRARGAGGPVEAMDKTVEEILKRQRRMRGDGAEILAESTLEWARQQARLNPELLDEVEELRRGIASKFGRLGRHVAVVNGNVLRGTRSEWGAIASALSSATEQAREEVSQDFTAIQQQAVGSLTSMGYSPAQARRLVRSIEQGGRAGRAARQATRSRTGVDGGMSIRGLLQGQRGRTTERPGTGDGPGMTDAIGPAGLALAAAGPISLTTRSHLTVDGPGRLTAHPSVDTRGAGLLAIPPQAMPMWDGAPPNAEPSRTPATPVRGVVPRSRAAVARRTAGAAYMGGGLSWAHAAPAEVAERRAARRAVGASAHFVGVDGSEDVAWQPGQSRAELMFQLMPMFERYVDFVMQVAQDPESAAASLATRGAKAVGSRA